MTSAELKKLAGQRWSQLQQWYASLTIFGTVLNPTRANQFFMYALVQAVLFSNFSHCLIILRQ